jgi:chitin deacetylase
MKTKRRLTTALVIFLLVLVVGYLLFRVSKSRTFQFFGDIYDNVNTKEKVVALTFDDAPTKYSKEVVDTLRSKGVKATFYAIGKNIEQFPDEAKYIVENGQEIGNHSYSHKRFLLKSPSFVESEIQKTNDLIRNIGYKEEITFRPPYGKKLFILPWYLNRQKIKTIMVDVEPETGMPKFDNDEKKTRYLIDHTVENTKPGSIILLHPFCNQCTSARQAVGQIVDKLKSKGYEFVTVSELLKYDR